MIKKLSRRRQHRKSTGVYFQDSFSQGRETPDHSREEFREVLEKVVTERDSLLRRLADE